MKLFSEAVDHDIEYITEENDNGKKNYKIKGIFMQADIKNRNGRVYPMEVLQKEVAKYNSSKKIVHMVNLDIQTDQLSIWSEYPT